jgi:serine/threonine protein kinase
LDSGSLIAVAAVARVQRYNPVRLDDEVDRRARARVGNVLDDKWTLERLLGIGGMAAVYAARHRNGARAAVKVLHPVLSRHEEVRERFQREGYAANQVEHPGAVKVLDDDVVSSGPDAGTAYIVMELLEGRSMQERLERGPPMSEVEFLQIADRVLDVLRDAHTRGVVHRDLKPENLFLVHDDERPLRLRVKVLDFGLARLLQGQAITTYGLALGTPSFMSPEQAAGRLEEIDGGTDLFALAATGFRVRAGRRIHEGTNAVELVTKMASLPAPRIRTIAPEVSAAFARVIDRALEFRRSDRYATAAEMQSDVLRAISELDMEKGPTQLAVATSSVVPAVERESPTIEISRRDIEPSVPERIDRSRARWISVVPWVAAVLLPAMGIGLWMGSRPRSVSPQGASGSSVAGSFLEVPQTSTPDLEVEGSLAPNESTGPTARDAALPTPAASVPARAAPAAAAASAGASRHGVPAKSPGGATKLVHKHRADTPTEKRRPQ